jgi:hypothetical protein
MPPKPIWYNEEWDTEANVYITPPEDGDCTFLDSKMKGEEVCGQLVKVGECYTIHSYNSPLFFKPTLDEVYTSMDPTFSDTAAFMINCVGNGEGFTHVARCQFFNVVDEPRCLGEVACLLCETHPDYEEPWMGFHPHKVRVYNNVKETLDRLIASWMAKLFIERREEESDEEIAEYSYKRYEKLTRDTGIWPGNWKITVFYYDGKEIVEHEHDESRINKFLLEIMK